MSGFKRPRGTCVVMVERDGQVIETVEYDDPADLFPDRPSDFVFTPFPQFSLTDYGESPFGPPWYVAYHKFKELITVNAGEELQVSLVYTVQDPLP